MDRDRKPVSFRLKSRGVKRPLASRDNLNPDSDARKRHMVSRFVNLMKTGTIQVATTRAVKDVIETGRVRRIRRMVSPLSQGSQSLIVEVDASQNDLTELKQTVASLQRDMQSVQETVNALQGEILKGKETVNALQHHVDMHRSIIVVAFEITVRAFTDKLLEAFYIAGGKGSADFSDQARWLRSSDAIEFCKEPAGRSLEIFGTKRKPNLNMLKMMQKLREISSNISKGNAHATSPINVAYALESLSDLKNVNVVHKFFRMCFNMDAKHMVNRKVAGTLSPEYLTRFTLGR